MQNNSKYVLSRNRLKTSTWNVLFLILCVISPFLMAQTEFLKIEEPPIGLQRKWIFYKPTQYLKIDPYEIHLLGSSSVSDWMMRESYNLIQQMVGALKHPEDRKKFSDHQAFLITDADPAISKTGQRNTGGKGFSLFNESLVCREAVDTLYPGNKPIYRAWDTPVHEFGHAIEHTLGLESKSDEIFLKNLPNYDPKMAREYFAWGTQEWFSSNHRSRGRGGMPKWQYDYFSDIFDADNDWVPVDSKQL